MRSKYKDRADKDSNTDYHYLEKRTMSCGVTLLCVHNHTNTQTRVTGGDLSLKRAISSSERNIRILIQGWTGRKGTEDRHSGIPYQGFTHRVREQVHGALWRISRITQTPTSAALGIHGTQLSFKISSQYNSGLLPIPKF